MNGKLYPGRLKKFALVGMVLSLGGVLLAQRAPETTLVVNGKAVGVSVLQVGGHTYVDIETLAQITNGQVTYEPNRVALAIPPPVSSPSSPASTDDSRAKSAPGLSRDFAGAAIASLTEMNEWKAALGTMVSYGLAAGGSYAQSYQNQVVASIGAANDSAVTDSDRNTLEMLNAEYRALSKWASDVFAERQALNGGRTVDPNALQSDPVLSKISVCGNFLGPMIVSGVFTDNINCH